MPLWSVHIQDDILPVSGADIKGRIDQGSQHTVLFGHSRRIHRLGGGRACRPGTIPQLFLWFCWRKEQESPKLHVMCFLPRRGWSWTLMVHIVNACCEGTSDSVSRWVPCPSHPSLCGWSHSHFYWCQDWLYEPSGHRWSHHGFPWALVCNYLRLFEWKSGCGARGPCKAVI